MHYYNCEVCDTMVPVEEVKYHTSPNENNEAYIFCGPECSLKWFQNNNK
jgi:hypothetical protein|tara:strand:+ start:741 stop:887 length:147 start_codon:yes stop_codon:yes gene_type:complete